MYNAPICTHTTPTDTHRLILIVRVQTPNATTLRYSSVLLGQYPCLLSLAIHEVLSAQVKVTASLEQAAQLECPRHSSLTEEEVRHLEHIADDPIDEHADPEAFAAARLGVLPDLRQR
jgi:hypothetical protein